jgi:adenosine deaminase
MRAGGPPIDPLEDVPTDASLLALPKADLHVHQEEMARLDRIVARQQGRSPYDWRRWARRLVTNTPPGPRRLSGMYVPDTSLALDGVPSDAPEYIIAKVADVLEEGAAEGAMLMEVRFGTAGQALMQPNFMALFREAERRVQLRYPQLRAEALGLLPLVHEPAHILRTEQHVATCVQMAREGLAGVDFLVNPYHTEADPALWEITYHYAERALDAGLGITVHAGEFSAANLAAALRVPGLRRIGHAVYAAHAPRLLEQVARSGVTVECCLTCNVLLGAVPSYDAHPIRRFVACGIPVTLNTDDPVRVCTTIGREYAIAAALGFSRDDLLAFTRAAVHASFTSVDRKVALLQELDYWGGS